MKFNQIPIVLVVTMLISACNFTEKDKHPEIPFFHEILNDKNVFISIYKTNKEPIFINDGTFLTVSSSDLPNSETASKDIKKTEGRVLYEFELRNFSGNVILNEKILAEDYLNSPNVFIDSNSNVYINDVKYLAPSYTQKQKIELIIIQKELNDYSSTTKNPLNLSLDSLQKEQLLVLQKKYNFIARKDEEFILQKGRLIMLTNQLVNEFKPKFRYFDEFDSPSTIKYISHGRLNKTPYKYCYYNYKNIKFKYSQPESGLEPPQIFKSEGQNIMFHPKYGFYKIL
jgi:hypothetical protein